MQILGHSSVGTPLPAPQTYILHLPCRGAPLLRALTLLSGMCSVPPTLSVQRTSQVRSHLVHSPTEPALHAAADREAEPAPPDLLQKGSVFFFLHKLSFKQLRCQTLPVPAVMPVETVGFHLKPVGFFKHNPALDLPRTVNTASKLASQCCGSLGSRDSAMMVNGNGHANGHANGHSNGIAALADQAAPRVANVEE